MSISKAATNDVVAAAPSNNGGVVALGINCTPMANSAKAAISTMEMMRPRTSAGSSSARLSSQKNSGTAANLTMMLVSRNARDHA